jgi:hypothetical protein
VHLAANPSGSSGFPVEGPHSSQGFLNERSFRDLLSYCTRNVQVVPYDIPTVTLPGSIWWFYYYASAARIAMWIKDITDNLAFSHFGIRRLGLGEN